MQKSGIEYLVNQDGSRGYVWNFYTGCLNKQNGVCTLPCWAKAIYHRFGRSFEPAFSNDMRVWDAPLKVKQSARVGVCFTGDLFGDWVEGMGNSLENHDTHAYIFQVIRQCPQHQFFFLTKCPWNLKKWGRFPDNAWVGVSVCDDDMLSDAMSGLNAVEAKHKWLSLEPLLDPVDAGRITYYLKEQSLSWIVIGGQTHPDFIPDKRWIDSILAVADKNNIPVWLKNNMRISPSEKLRQELPK